MGFIHRVPKRVLKSFGVLAVSWFSKFHAWFQRGFPAGLSNGHGVIGFPTIKVSGSDAVLKFQQVSQ